MLIGGVVQAEIYQWTDKDGGVHFSDQAPEKAVAERIGKKLLINSYPGIDVTNSDFLDQRDTERRAKARHKRRRVVMYSAVWCGVCKRARQYFKANKIPFKEYDVETSAKGKQDYLRMKGRGVPIILVASQRMDGFNGARFKQLYGDWLLAGRFCLKPHKG